MATIILFQDGRSDFPSSGNTISLDGATPIRILSNMFKHYKLDSGEHTLVVKSSNGQAWEISAYVGYSECLNIKVQIDRDSNIIYVAYKVAPEQPTMALFAKEFPK